jgi:protein-tyrosine phosphatase
MAEVLTTRIGRGLGIDSLEVRSAGTHTQDGMPASDGASRAAARKGLSLEAHASSLLTRELVDWADWIFVMGVGHLRQVEAMGGGGKAFLLGAFAGPGDPWTATRERGETLAVPDPFGGDDEVYEETFRTLEIFVESTLKKLTVKGEG